MRKLGIVFAGFRHDHILNLYQIAQKHPYIEVIGSCEEHTATRAIISKNHNIEFTHKTIETLLDTNCDIVAIGDYFTRRGKIAISALERGLHVIADKPLCTDLDQHKRISSLARERDLKVGCMLTQRDSSSTLVARKLITDELRIGPVHAIHFGGQHPLRINNRPNWYFEKNKHGGTITDIAIHAIDTIPWITGLQFEQIQAARTWNALVPEYPHFHDAAQLMVSMNNGCGVIGDVSYFAPDRSGYQMPQYWRTTYWGRDGLIEISANMGVAHLLTKSDEKVQTINLPVGKSGGYFQAFLDDINNLPPNNGLNTLSVLKSMHTTLQIQQAADEHIRDVSI